jgi:hypothetical protein
MTNGWEAEPPAGEHLIVVSHRPKPEGWHPEADVPFFDDVAAAVEEAKRRAGDRLVRPHRVAEARHLVDGA